MVRVQRKQIEKIRLALRHKYRHPFLRRNQASLFRNSMDDFICTRTERSVRIAARIITFLSRLLFTRVIVKGKEHLQDIDQSSGQTVYLFSPSHKSNLDSYLVGLALLEYRNVEFPFFVATQLLKYWPIKSYLRKIGGYFICQGQFHPLYLQMLKDFITELLKVGVNQTFFLEGHLSRTGFFEPINTGLVKFLVEAHLRVPDIALRIVPVSIVFDFVPEDTFMSQTLKRDFRRPSPILSIFQTLGKIRKYGDVTLEFGKPIDCSSFYPPAYQTDPGSVKIKKTAREIGEAVMQAIRVLPRLTPAMVVAKLMLDSDSDFLAHERVESRLRSHFPDISGEQIRYTMKKLQARKVIHKEIDGYRITGCNAHLVAYYRNMYQDNAASGA
jgi:glycerol-3-phosphate O-acyltransferase